MNRAKFIGLFLDEARQHIDQAYEQLKKFEVYPQRPDTLQSLMRHCHSLKGMAASMGFEPFVELAHRMEGLLRELERRPRLWSGQLAPLFGQGLDQMSRWADRIACGESPLRDETTGALISRLDGLLNDNGTRAPAHAVAETPRRPDHWSVRMALQVSSASPTHRIVSTLKRIGTLGRVLRVRPPQLPLDETPAAMELEFDLSSPRSRQTLQRRMARFAWVSAVELSAIPTDPAQPAPPEAATVWTRVPADALDWMADTLRELAMERAATNEKDSTPQRPGGDRSSFLIRRLFTRVEEWRLVPFVSVSHRLEPAVADAARREGKQARLRVDGGDLGLDRALLDRLVGPLRHLVRNAVAHGIESPQGRLDANKPIEGTVSLSVARVGDRVSVTVSDDGKGMDAAAIRSAAIHAGQIENTRAQDLDDQALLELAFRPGVSTRDVADGVAGRGAGLDAAVRDLHELGAALTVSTTCGQGSEFTFELPVGQALVQSLVFRRDGQLFGLPLTSLRRATPRETAPAGIEIVDLGTRDCVESDKGYLLVLDEPERHVALVADEVLGRRELWLQPMAPAFATTTYVNGAAMIENGALAVMIDPKKLLSRPW
jgi:two-component system chemotaxis sensor kinase CheA